MALAGGVISACSGEKPPAQDASQTAPTAQATPAAQTTGRTYRQDRGFDKGMPSSEFSRLYPGRMSTQRCLGYTLQQCQTLPAVIEHYECRSRADGLSVCDGKRPLFFGTESSHKPVGLEQREFRLRDGKIEAEWAVVQIVEERVFGAQPETATRRCERFGEVGLADCNGVEPIGSLPLLALDGPSFSRAYTPDELSAIAGTVQMIQFCIQTVPEIRKDAEATYANWRAPRADVVTFMEQKLSSTISSAVDAARAQPPDSQSKAMCGGMLVSLESQSRAPNPKLSTAESTWSTFKAALTSGDAKAAGDCFANRYDQFGEIMSQASAEDLARYAAAFVEFEMIDGPDKKEWRRGLVTRADGISGEVVFVKMGSEWRISQM